MVEMRTYDQDYIDTCRSRSEAQVAAFDFARSRADADGTDPVGAIEADFFNNMLLVLEGCFVHRSREVEGREGNPLTEVRVLASSLMTNGGTLATGGEVTLDPARSVLGYAEGDDIHLTQEQYVLLSNAFFDDLERRFVER
jgi:hypothetical protein